MKKKIIKNKKRPGFTLVEMVIVITIMGILSSLGFMKFEQVQQNAKVKADHVAAESLATAATLALNDKNGPKATDGKMEISDLKEAGYLSVEPKPQSKDGNFEININGDEVTVMIDGKSFYPLPDNPVQTETD